MARIAIDALFLDPDRRGGAETYARSLFPEILKQNRQHHFIAFVPKGFDHPFDPGLCEVVPLPVNPSHRNRRILWEQTFLPGIMKKYEPDLIHFPYSVATWKTPAPSLVTIHDSLRFQRPDLSIKSVDLFYSFLQRRSVKRGDHFITVSHHDGKVLRENLGFSPEREHVIYHGLAPCFLEASPREGTSDYMLWAGRPYAHKNLETLLAGLAILQKGGKDFPLLRLVGADFPGSPVPALVEGHSLQKMVQIEPFVSHESLVALYQGAQIMCFPSACESFGLPLLEAMACGTPALCSDLPVFLELAEGKAWFAKVHKPEEWAERIIWMLEHPDEVMQKAARGREQARSFTWEKAARETLSVYEGLFSAG